MNIMIAIHDTGTGIEPAIAEKDFEPFYLEERERVLDLVLQWSMRLSVGQEVCQG